MSHIVRSILMTTVTATALLPIMADAGDAAPPSKNNNVSQEPLEEVVVTGIRRSLEAALDVKRDAESFVDAISSEDVGKLPDANLAEVMQRVPGVAIQRTRGEGDFISIRGLGPNFVRGELDGRTMVSATESSEWTRNGGVFASTGRSTNFDVLPAEIVRKLEVIKSPTASMIEGGIGGVVNVITQEPLDLGNHYFLSANSEYRALNDTSDPSVSGLASWRNDAETFGILANVGYSRRSIREDGVDSYGWATPTNWAAWPDIDSTGSGAPDLVGFSSPWTVHPRQDNDTRKRTTAEAKAQWRMPDDAVLTASVLYSRRTADVEDMVGVIGIGPTGFVNPPPSLVPPGKSGISLLGNCATNPPPGGFCTVPGATGANGAMRSLDVSSSLTNSFHLLEQEDSLTATGLNYRKSFGRLSVDGDLSYSRALGSILDTGGAVQLAYVTPWHFWTDGDRLQMQAIGSPDISSPGNYYTRGMGSTKRDSDQSEKALALNAQLELENVPLSRALEFGIRWAQRDVERVQRFDPQAHDGNFLLTGYTGVHPTGNFGDGSFAVPFNQFLFMRPDRLQAALQALDPANNTAFGPSKFDALNSYGVKEDTYALYVQLDLETELFGLPLKGNVGVRGVETRVTTTGYYQPFTIEYNQQNVGHFVYTSPDIASTDFENDYFNLLPALNLQLDVRDDLLLRFAVGKSVTRPDFQTQLAPALSGINAQNKIASAGNPSLEAYSSTNVDVGMEWYLAPSSALWVAGFYKSIDNFIGASTQFNATRFGYTWNSLNTPENQGKAKIEGAEIGYQHVWPIGVGYVLNATYATSSAHYTSGVNAGKVLPFEGVSRVSYNGALFYEKGGFNARLAYSHRDKYVLLASDVFGLTEYSAPYGQLDASVSYALNDNWTVVADAVNLTDEKNRIYTINSGNPLSYTLVGPRYGVGVRAKF